MKPSNHPVITGLVLIPAEDKLLTDKRCYVTYTMSQNLFCREEVF